jgi:Tfp pilus assembly protein PilF
MSEEIQQQILDELRNQTAIGKKYRRDGRIFLIVFLILFIGVVAATPFMHRLLSSASASSQRVDSWTLARDLIYQGEDSKAEAMLQKLLKRSPDFYYGYSLLGFLYQVHGDAKKAEVNYAKAYDLFPTEENQKTLDAIRMVLDRKNTTATGNP